MCTLDRGAAHEFFVRPWSYPGHELAPPWSTGCFRTHRDVNVSAAFRNRCLNHTSGVHIWRAIRLRFLASCGEGPRTRAPASACEIWSRRKNTSGVDPGANPATALLSGNPTHLLTKTLWGALADIVEEMFGGKAETGAAPARAAQVVT